MHDYQPPSSCYVFAAPSAKKRKRQVSYTTFKKWQANLEKDHRTLSWLKCDLDASDRSVVDTLWCQVCRKYEERLQGMKNYSTIWITGSTNHKTSNVIDHSNSDQHKAAMIQVRKAANEPIKMYSPLARCLLSMDETTKKRMEKKFDIAYLLAKENLAFMKYPAVYQLEAKHNVDLGIAYKTKESAKSFVHYIAESQRASFIRSLSKCRFYSFLMDGSTDSGNIEDELIVIMYCIKDDVAEKVKSCARFFEVQVPDGRADADGLILCLGRALEKLGIQNVLDKDSVLGVESKPILVGGGTDGASVNVAEQNGMKGKLQRELPWIHWAWCYAHRLELACKDAMTSQLFTDLVEMLLRLYYVYSKSPKKCRELSDIVENLKEVFEFPNGGNQPVRSQGSRWISHKRKALQRLVDRYGAYMSHLLTLVEDPTVTGEDKAKLKGYVQKWKQSRLLVGAAMYVDVLKCPSILSLSLQDDYLDIIGGIKNIVKSSKALRTMCDQDPQQWPTAKLVTARIKKEDDSFVYQGAVLQGYGPSVLDQCSKSALTDLRKLDQEMKTRLEWSDVELLRSILIFLDTQSWVQSEDAESEVSTAVEYIMTHFRAPLEASSSNLASIQDELEEVLDYARKYLSIASESYQNIWYKLHTVPDADKWPNILILAELLFSLPFSNAKVERIFSTLKIVKTDRRTSLNTSTLSDLLEIQVEGPSLQEFKADEAIRLWWDDCCTTRRVNQNPRKPYKPRSDSAASSSISSSDTSEAETSASATSLSVWDDWFDL